MDYSAIKAAMREAGHLVTEGTEWAAKDAIEFRDYCHRHLGIPFDMAHHVIEYPTHFMHKLGEAFYALFGTHHTVLALDPANLPPAVKAPEPGMLAEPTGSNPDTPTADASGMLTPPVEQPAATAPEAPPASPEAPAAVAPEAPPAEVKTEEPEAPPAAVEGAEGAGDDGKNEGDKPAGDSELDLTPKE